MSSIGLWEIAILALLREAPRHPYEMQRLLKERHTDELLPLKRGSLYHAIERLVKAGLIEAISTSRQGGRPERTTYRLVTAGEAALLERLRESIAVVEPEKSDFMASISHLLHLAPEDARAQLEARAGELEGQIARFDAGMQRLVKRIGRIHLVELDYWLAMRRAELAWVRGIVDDIRARRLDWDFSAALADAMAADAEIPAKEPKTKG